VRAILKSASDIDATLEVISSVEQVNKRQPVRFFEKIRGHFDGELANHRVAIWGLAYKANTDDTRESPAFVIIDQLLAAGATVVAYDPEAMEGTRRRYGNRITYGASMYETARDADTLVILTEWNEFRNPDFERLGECLKNRVIFDGRNLFNNEEMASKGYIYYSVGRGVISVDINAEAKQIPSK
jgi:UDPglucose 6-dehydrogenase